MSNLDFAHECSYNLDADGVIRCAICGREDDFEDSLDDLKLVRCRECGEQFMSANKLLCAECRDELGFYEVQLGDDDND